MSQSRTGSSLRNDDNNNGEFIKRFQRLRVLYNFIKEKTWNAQVTHIQIDDM